MPGNVTGGNEMHLCGGDSKIFYWASTRNSPCCYAQYPVRPSLRFYLNFNLRDCVAKAGQSNNVYLQVKPVILISSRLRGKKKVMEKKVWIFVYYKSTLLLTQRNGSELALLCKKSLIIPHHRPTSLQTAVSSCESCRCKAQSTTDVAWFLK